MTRRDWIVSIYAGAAWAASSGSFFSVFTKLGGTDPLTPNAVLATVAVPIVVGIAGMALFRLTAGTTSRRAGAAVSIGTFVGLPVLAWVALW